MANKLFAAIDVGSFELSMKILEFSSKKTGRVIEHIRKSIDLGTDTYRHQRINHDRMDELCGALKEFSDIMKGYRIQEYRACGTSAIREMENREIVLDQIHQRTGIKIDVLSNSEQRFLNYKAVAFAGEQFQEIITEGTAILDIGGGSIQVSLFDNDTLVSTQNLRLGVLRLQEMLRNMDARVGQWELLLNELADAQFASFMKLYMKDRVIKNLIVVDDYMSTWIGTRTGENGKSGIAKVEEYNQFMERVRMNPMTEIMKEMGVSREHAELTFISALLIKSFMKLTDTQKIWAPGVTLADGIAYEYAEKNRLLLCDHDFNRDILACASNISKRYQGSRKRGENLEKITLSIFDSMKKVHGLGKRERLYLQLAALLHDCGKYISMMQIGETSYQIIMATEMIGLSHRERQIVASIVRYNHSDFKYYDQMILDGIDFSKEDYLTVAKLTAILRISNALDRSHKQKVTSVKGTLVGEELILNVSTLEDMTLEKGILLSRVDFFREVFCITPVLKLV